MQNQMRERQMAMQIAWSREFLKYFGTFFTLATMGLTVGWVFCGHRCQLSSIICLWRQQTLNKAQWEKNKYLPMKCNSFLRIWVFTACTSVYDVLLHPVLFSNPVNVAHLLKAPTGGAKASFKKPLKCQWSNSLTLHFHFSRVFSYCKTPKKSTSLSTILLCV